MKLNFIIVFYFLIINLQYVDAQAPYGNAGDHTPVMLENSEAPYGYYEYLPVDFNATSGVKYPVVLFYHGIGERGNGNSELGKVLVHGPPKLIEKGKDFPAIVISPQSHGGWSDPQSFLKIYNYLKENYPIDLNRFYVTGLSSGGTGTWIALETNYTKIAAAIPICGPRYLSNSSEFLQQTPIWVHYSFKDHIGREETIANVNKIANTGISVMTTYPYRIRRATKIVAKKDYTMQFDINSKKWYSQVGVKKPINKMSFTMYKRGKHDYSWTKAYKNQDVWDWLFEQRL